MPIIPATLAHIDVLASLHGEAFADDPWDRESFARLLVLPGLLARLALSGSGEPAGLCLWRQVLDEAELLTIGVSPRYRRQGIGRALIADGLATLDQQQVAFIFLEVAIENVPANNLYADFGFDTINRRRGYYKRAGSAAVDALVMRRQRPEEHMADRHQPHDNGEMT